MPDEGNKIEQWLRQTTWRDIRIFQYGGRIHAEAREFPNLDSTSIVVTTGSGSTPDEALYQLAQKLRRPAP